MKTLVPFLNRNTMGMGRGELLQRAVLGITRHLATLTPRPFLPYAGWKEDAFSPGILTRGKASAALVLDLRLVKVLMSV